MVKGFEKTTSPIAKTAKKYTDIYRKYEKSGQFIEKID
jgi:hypothetical protein